MSQPIVWCCPLCQRSFDVGHCPEHGDDPQLIDVLKRSADFLYKQGVGDGAAAVDEAIRVLAARHERVACSHQINRGRSE